MRWRDLRHDAFERERSVGSRGPLNPADITRAEHADLTVRPRLLGDPSDRVVAVLAFVDKWLPQSSTVVASAHVLRDQHISARGPPCAVEGRLFATVRRAF